MTGCPHLAKGEGGQVLAIEGQVIKIEQFLYK